MGFFQLSNDELFKFADAPEIHMGLQVARDSQSKYFLVISGRIALTFDETLDSDMALFQEIVGTARDEKESVAERMEAWTRRLVIISGLNLVPQSEALQTLGFVHLGPFGPWMIPPAPPASTYGHLPLHGICSGEEVFYRYEAYPKSLRIDQTAMKIVKPGTFAAPPSELPFIPTGLAAVSRYALPSILPARWRWEIRPEAGTHMRYGACVPLYGQSGGGVEVCFTSPFDNVGPIANPVILSIF